MSAKIISGNEVSQILKDEMNEKGMILLSIYFLQPILSFWGLSSRPIDLSLLEAPFWYVTISLIGVLLSSIIAFFFFKNDVQEKSIITICVILGNTGNLGIPLGIALFGDASIIYTSMINIANVFIVYTFIE